MLHMCGLPPATKFNASHRCLNIPALHHCIQKMSQKSPSSRPKESSRSSATPVVGLRNQKLLVMVDVAYRGTTKACLSTKIGAQHKKRDSVENKPASLLVVSLGKALNGMLPSL